MRKLLFAALLSIVFAGCQNTILDTPPTEEITRTLTIGVGIDTSADAPTSKTDITIGETGWTMEWNAADKLGGYAPTATAFTQFTTTVDGTNPKYAEFTGTIASGDYLRLVYPYIESAIASNIAPVSLTSQVVDLSDTDAKIGDNLYMISEAKIDISSGESKYENVKMKHIGAGLEIRLNVENLPTEATTLTLKSVEITGFDSKAGLDLDKLLTEKYLSEAAKETITVVVESGAITANTTYAIPVAILPQTITGDVSFTASFIDQLGNYYTATKELTLSARAFNRAVVTPVTFEFTSLTPYEIPKVGDVYQLSNAMDLRILSAKIAAEDADYVTANYKMTKDIDLGGIDSDGNGVAAAEFTAIGTYSTPFKGTFDGGGFTVKGLYINQPSKEDQALFGSIKESATIKNLSVAGVVTGKNYVGGVVGSSSYSSVINCHNSAVVTGSDNVGGVVGYSQHSSSVTNCYNSAAVTGGERIGGVEGYSDYSSSVTNCYNSASVTGSSYVGGVVGYSSSTFPSVTNCYYANDIVDAPSKGVGSGIDSTTGMDLAEMKEGTFVTTLNNGAYIYNTTPIGDPATVPAIKACAWKAATNSTPALNFGVVPTELITD